jgi:hypothetical protein
MRDFDAFYLSHGVNVWATLIRAISVMAMVIPRILGVAVAPECLEPCLAI